MKIFFGILLIFVVMYMFFLPAAYLKYAREEEAEFSGLLLSKAVDYAGEAAISACIETVDLEMAHINESYMVLSPEKSANVFASVLCLSYGIPVSEQNIDNIIIKIPTMALAVNDGYYVAEWKNTDESAALIWQPKKAYIIDSNPDELNHGLCYGLELNMKNLSIIDKQSLSVTQSADYSIFPFNKETVLQYINRCLNKDINAVLARYAEQWGKSTVQSFYLPVSAGISGVQRIEKPSLIIVMQDLDMDGIRPRNLSVLSGMRITEKRNVVGWTDGSGRKYYCYSGNADNEAQGYISSNGIIFNSIQEAAAAGYVPYR